jgi:hypothetical protein
VIDRFFSFYHFCYQVVEYRFLTLESINPEAEIIKAPVQVALAYPRMGCPNPAFNLMNHGV